MIKHITVSGSHYECGLQIGQSLKEEIRIRIETHITDDVFNRLSTKAQITQETCRKLCPQFIEELEGMAEGAEISFDKIFLLNCEELRDSEVGCTTIAEVSKDTISIFHNEDTGDDSEEFALITYNLPDYSLTAFSYAGSLPGDAFGWNGFGTCVTVNYLAPIDKEVDPTRLPRNFTGRALLEAKDINHGLEILRTCPDATGYHYFMGHGNRIVSVEQYKDDLSVQDVSGRMAHANHYIHPQFVQKASGDENTKTRQERADTLIADEVTNSDILLNTQDAPNSICRREGDNGRTLSSVEFNLTEKLVHIKNPETGVTELSFSI